MQQNGCKQVLGMGAEAMSQIFKDNLPSGLSDKILSCLYRCFQPVFIKWALIKYNYYPEDVISFLSQNSFTDSVIKFKETAATTGLYNGNAGTKTILFNFYKNTLWGNLQQENRLAAKNQRLAPVLAMANNTLYEDEGRPKELLYATLEQALQQMEEADRQIIIWRHLEEKSNVEIAAQLGINVPSATNRIYRCMQRLKQLTENIDQPWT